MKHLLGWMPTRVGRFTVVFAALFAALYPTIWLHEVAHSAAAFALGCKADLLQTGFRLLLFDSTGGAIDHVCLAAQGPRAVAIMGGAGIAANIVVGCLSAVVGCRVPGPKMEAVLFLLALANSIEALSYLTGSTVVLRSDMLAVQPVLPIPPVALALLSTAVGLPLLIWLTRRCADALERATGFRDLPGPLAVGVSLVMVAMVWGRLDYTLITQAG